MSKNSDVPQQGSRSVRVVPQSPYPEEETVQVTPHGITVGSEVPLKNKDIKDYLERQEQAFKQ